MGLDMYLKQKKYISGFDHEEDVMKIKELAGLEDCEGGVEVYGEACYWRKAYSICEWFERRLDGVENCQDYYVDEDLIIELRDLCKQIIDGGDRTGLPMSEWDDEEYYMAQVKRTYEMFSKLDLGGNYDYFFHIWY